MYLEFLILACTIYILAPGWLLLAWGIGQLVLAFKNEDADSKSRAMMLIVVAIILTVVGTIFNGLNMGVSADTNKDI